MKQIAKIVKKGTTGQVVIRLAQFLIETGAPQLFLRELEKLCNKYAKGKRWHFGHDY